MRRTAYYPRPVSQLKQYLTLSDDDKGAELARADPYSFIWWIENRRPDLLEDGEHDEIEDLVTSHDYDYVDAALDELTREDLADFWRATKHQAGSTGDIEDALLPSFVYMDFDSIVKNQWLVHFTKNAQSIVDQGFTQGMDDYRRLGLTTWFKTRFDEWDLEEHNIDVSAPGHNFAYTLDDYLRYGVRRDTGRAETWRYGTEAVIFRAAGVRVHHHGDREHQVIFWGPSAHSIIPVTIPVTSCRTGQVLAATDTIDWSIDWVVDNFEQYRRHLLCD